MGVVNQTILVVVILNNAWSAAGQAQWVPGGGEGEEGAGEEEIVYVGSENKPRKLGFVYCLNRPSAIYHAHLDSGKISE